MWWLTLALFLGGAACGGHAPPARRAPPAPTTAEVVVRCDAALEARATGAPSPGVAAVCSPLFDAEPCRDAWFALASGGVINPWTEVAVVCAEAYCERLAPRALVLCERAAELLAPEWRLGAAAALFEAIVEGALGDRDLREVGRKLGQLVASAQGATAEPEALPERSDD